MNDLRKLSPEEQNNRSRQVVRMRLDGKSNREIADTLGYCYAHISTIWKKYKMGNLDLDSPSPKVRGRKLGDKRVLNAAQEDRIINLLIDNSPAQLKLDHVSCLWTSKSIRLAIKQEIGVELPFRTISHYRKKWGFVPQKPTDRAQEQNKELFQHWLETEYKEIIGRIRKETAEIHWFDYADVTIEARDSSDKGELPEDCHNDNRCIIKMISTIYRGKYRFMLFRESVTIQNVHLFLGRLAKDCNRNIFLILYNSPVFHSLRLHHSHKENEEISLKNGHTIIFRFLPSNLPEHNPDEHARTEIPEKKLHWVRSNT